jgi:uncharacterized protein (TIGR02594 family)
MNIPKAYQWLQQEDGPRHMLKAIELYGVVETVGSKHNPVIMGWAKDLSIQNVYVNDEIPWCGLYVAIVMKRSDQPGSPRPVVASPLWALNWGNFGVAVSVPMFGDVLTFKRDGGGHVGFYVGEDATAYHVLGGNQGNKVCVTRIAKSRLQKARRPVYHTQPLNVRRIFLASNGALSQNEA